MAELTKEQQEHIDAICREVGLEPIKPDKPLTEEEKKQANIDKILAQI